MQELIMLNESNTMGGGAATTVLILLIGCLLILPLLYWGNWMNDDYEDGYVWKDGKWQAPIPEPDPTMYVFYSPGMKEVIDKTLKPVVNPVEIDTKSVEIDK